MQEAGDPGSLERIGSAPRWRPQARTAALLIGGFFLYFAAVAVRSLPDLVSEVLGTCVGPAGFSGYVCQLPSWARELAAVNLAVPVADLVVVAGAALAFAGRRAGHNLMIGALIAVAAAEIAGIAVIASGGPPGVDLATTWTSVVSAVAALTLSGLVASLRD